MPGRRRAPVTRPRARNTKRRAEPFPLILEIEVPLTDAIHYAEALRLVGHGLIAQDDDGGEAIVALAGATEQRLEAVRTIWNKMLDERRRNTRWMAARLLRIGMRQPRSSTT